MDPISDLPSASDGVVAASAIDKDGAVEDNDEDEAPPHPPPPPPPVLPPVLDEDLDNEASLSRQVAKSKKLYLRDNCALCVFFVT